MMTPQTILAADRSTHRSISACVAIKHSRSESQISTTDLVVESRPAAESRNLRHLRLVNVTSLYVTLLLLHLHKDVPTVRWIAWPLVPRRSVHQHHAGMC